MLTLQGAVAHCRAFITPNEYVTRRVYTYITTTYIALALSMWLLCPPKILPTLDSTFKAFPALWEAGLGYELWVSITLNAQAVSLMALVSLVVSYGTALVLIR